VQLCDRINAQGIRCDVDDRNETVSKKIRNGEKEWIPYLLVVGKKEAESGQLTVRSREEGSQAQMAVDQFVAMVRDRIKGMPYRPLPLPRRTTMRPIFFG
jgi:threonyl-tRNA synthetase